MPRKGDKQFDETAVLERAMDLFWEQGYEATGMSELVAQMGVGRQSLYDTFGDKRSLFLSALEHYADTYQGAVLAVLEGSEPPLERIRRVVRMWQEGASGPHCRGCLLANSAAELGYADPEISEMIRARLRRLEDAIRRVLAEAVARGELSSDPPPRALARTLVAIANGMHVVGKTSPSKAAIADIADTALALIER